MAYLPADIFNQVLDCLGWDMTIGDPEEGSREAQIILRAYRNCLQQLFRGAHWNFSRRQIPLTLLADATGQTPLVGTIVAAPWLYSYQLPNDCAKARFVPWNPQGLAAPIPAGNIQRPVQPNLPQTFAGQRIYPARFLVATDYNYIAPQGSITWEVQGVTPVSRTVILTNVQNANLVYTALMLFPSSWDPLFRAAMVAYLASETALPIWTQKDRKFGMALRQQQAQIAMEKIKQARITDGNEGGPTSNSIPTDWIQARYTSGGYGSWRGGLGMNGNCDGPGVLGYGWDAISIAGGPF